MNDTDNKFGMDGTKTLGCFSDDNSWIVNEFLSELENQKAQVKFLTTRKKDIGEGHACDTPLRSVTNVTYGDDP